VSGLDETFPWRAELRTGRIASGFLQTERGVLMLAASPLLDGFGHGPFRGTVLLGKHLSAAEIGRIGAQAQARLSMARLTRHAAAIGQDNDLTSRLDFQG
jgi:sensor domain CHASE-containing protein